MENNIEQRLLEVRQDVEEASNMDSKMEALYIMLGFQVETYKSLQGKVVAVYNNKRQKNTIQKLFINDIEYEVSYLDIGRDISRDGELIVHAFLIKDTYNIVLIINNFALILDVKDLNNIDNVEQLIYLIKANTNTKLSIEQLNSKFKSDIHYIEYIGRVGEYTKSDKNCKAAIMINGEAYLIRMASRFKETNQLLLVTESNNVIFIDGEEWFHIDLEHNALEYIVCDCFNLSTAEWLFDKIIKLGTCIIDTETHKIYSTRRGIWEVKADSNNRYFVSSVVEYIGVITEDISAVYDRIEKRVYYDRDKVGKLTDKDGNIYTGYPTYSIGVYKVDEFHEYSFKCKKINEEELRALIINN